MTVFFTICAFTSPKHFGAKVFGPIGPAQAAPRDLATAQVNAFEARRVNEDLEQRAGFGQSRYLRRIKFERQKWASRPGCTARTDTSAPVIGAQRCADQRQVLAKYSVFGKIRHLVERLLDRVHLARRGTFIGARRIKAQFEQTDQHACDTRVGGKRCFNKRLRQRKPGLPHDLRISTEHDDLVGRQLGAQHQAIEVVIFDGAFEYARKRLFEQRCDRLGIDVVDPRQLQREIVHPQRPAVLRSQLIAALGQNAHSHALEHRQRIRQSDRRATAIQLEAQAARRPFERPIQVERETAFGLVVQRGETADISDRLSRQHRFFIRCGKRRAKTLVQRRRACFSLFLI